MKKIILFLFISSTAYAERDWQFQHDVQLKNVYDDKNFKHAQDTGSWSQGIIYRGDLSKRWHNLQLSLLPSFQYAHRLGPSHNSSDGTYAFDSETQSQPQQFHKQGLALKVGHLHHTLQYGEQWLNLPLIGVDATKQLLPTYQGLVYSYTPSKNAEFSLGYINRYNPKDEEDFKKLQVANQQSDGLSYLNYRYKINPDAVVHVYNGYLDDLLNQFYVGVSHQQHISPNIENKLSIKYFNNIAVGQEKLGNLAVDYYGVMDDFRFKKMSVALGYQKIDGNQNFPLIMGIPARYFIHWTQGMFNKQDEASYHLNLKYDLSAHVPGLELTYKYIYGDGFKTGNLSNSEQEQDVLLAYQVPQGRLKGLGFQALYINYDTKIGRDYDEVRVSTKYQFKF